MILKKPPAHAFVLIVILIIAFPLSVFFINNALLSIYKKKYHPFFEKMSASYNDISSQNEEGFLTTLKNLNLKNIESYNRFYPISLLYQYDKNWQLLVSHSAKTSSKHHIRILNKEIVKSIRERDVSFLNLGQQLLFRFDHGENNLPLKYTVVTVRDKGFFRQKNFLLIIVIILFFILLICFLILFLFPWKNKILKKEKQAKAEVKQTINKKEPSVPKKTSANKEPVSHFVNQSENWKNDIKAETKKENDDFLNPDDHQTVEIKEDHSSPIKVNINSIEKENVRSFDEIFKYKQQLENQIEKLAIVKEIKLAFEYTNNVNDFLAAVTTLIHSKMPGDKVEIFLNHTARQEFLTNSSFLTLRCSIENDKVIHYSMEDEVSQKLMLNIGEEGRALSHLHGIILNEKNHSTLTVPMVEKMSIIGAIRLKSFQAGLYGHEEKFILEKLANHIANHLSHSNAYQKVT